MRLLSYLEWFAVVSHTYLAFPTAQSYIIRVSYEDFLYVCNAVK